jgi:hypothetical protein
VILLSALAVVFVGAQQQDFIFYQCHSQEGPDVEQTWQWSGSSTINPVSS